MKNVIEDCSTIKKIVDAIEGQKQVDNSWLVSFLQRIDIKPESLSKYQDFTHGNDKSYGRKVVYEGANFIVYVMSWAPGDFTAIHSHGFSDWGSVVFFADTNHRLYEADGQKIRLAGKSIIPKGSVVPVTGDFVHAMGNLTDTPFITLHIYGSNKAISNANDFSLVYEIEKKQIQTTSGAAYINISENLSKKTVHGLQTNVETLVDYLQIILPYYKKNNKHNAVATIEGYLREPETYFIKYEHEMQYNF